MAESALDIDAIVEVEVGAAAHGGSCVARLDGRVLFVRHALPGERVRARVTEDRGGSYFRADAIEVLDASPDRVTPPCPYAGPARCGGCDWQHASAEAQRQIKAAIIEEQFARIAGLSLDGVFDGVTELPGGLLGWRTRITYAVDGDGRVGLHRYRDRRIEHIDKCLLGAPGIGDADALHEQWPGLTGVEVARGDDIDLTPTVLAHRPGPGRQARGRRPPDRVTVVEGPARLRHRLRQREYTVSADGFWQVHPAAAEEIAAAVLSTTGLRSGERVLELYAGAGALTAVIAEAVGVTGEVLGIEWSVKAVEDAGHNLADLPWARVDRGRISAEFVAGLDFAPDVVVLDPPRAGAGPALMAGLLERRPRCVAYVSCDPASLARDVRAALNAASDTDSGTSWRLEKLRAFDAFPMTSHVECLAVLVPAFTDP